MSSGEELLTRPVEDWLDVLALKRELRQFCGLPRFRQRLLHNNTLLNDHDKVSKPMDLQLVLLPFVVTTLHDSRQLARAAQHADLPRVEALLQRPQRPRRRALLSAIQSGHLETLRLLLEAFADPGAATAFGRTVLHVAAEEHRTEIVQLLLKARADANATQNDGRTALHACYDSCRCAGADMVGRILLDAAADVQAADKDGLTALHLAARSGCVIGTSLLLSAGADPSATTPRGSTVLHEAATRGQTEIMQLLLEARADVHATRWTDGRTVLHDCYSNRCRDDQGVGEMGRILLDASVDVHKADNAGLMALHLAATAGHVIGTRLLLRRGASAAFLDNDGDSALQYAAWFGHVDTVHLLLSPPLKGVSASDAIKALRMASRRNNAAVACLLLEFLAHRPTLG